MPRVSYPPCSASEAFHRLLPGIERTIRYRLRLVPHRDREELHAAALAAAFVMFVRLVRRDRAQLASATPLGVYGARQALDGRSVGTSINIRDVFSRACQRRTGVQVQSLQGDDPLGGGWRELVVEDRRANPATLAALRIDFQTWLTSLTPRQRDVAERLATGESTQEAAKHFRVTSGRISQLRRELEASWRAFSREPRARTRRRAC